MSRIICVTGTFDVVVRGVPTGRKEFLVSHGVDEHTGRNVVLPTEHPSALGAKFDPDLGEWVIPAPDAAPQPAPRRPRF